GPGRLVPAARPVRLRGPQGRRAGHAALPVAEPACPAGPPRPCPGAEDQPHLALEGGIPGLLGAAVRPARTRLTSHPVPATRKGGSPARSEPGARPEHIGRHRHPPEIREPDKTAENWHNTISNQPRPPAESSRPGTASITRPGEKQCPAKRGAAREKNTAIRRCGGEVNLARCSREVPVKVFP